MLDLIVGPILAQIWPYVAGAVAALGLWLAARRSGTKAADAKRDKATIKTVERIQDAKERSHAGGAAWHDRLRDRDK